MEFLAFIGVILWIGFALTQDWMWLYKFLVGCEIGALHCFGSMGILDIPWAIFIQFGGYLYGFGVIIIFISKLIKSMFSSD